MAKQSGSTKTSTSRNPRVVNNVSQNKKTLQDFFLANGGQKDDNGIVTLKTRLAEYSVTDNYITIRENGSPDLQRTDLAMPNAGQRIINSIKLRMPEQNWKERKRR